ncbi:MAG TPA: hypothetical protein VH475_22600, partial [Tepidisphaeraceae bacterium]
MKCSPRRRAVLTLAISGLAFTLAGILAGCGDGDQRAADKRISKSVNEAIESRRNPTTQNVNAAVTELTKAAGEAGASLVGKIEAKSNLAQAEMEAGDRIVRDIDRLDPQINQASWEISQTAGQLQRLSDSATASESSNPQAVLKAIGDNRAQMVAAGEAASKKVAELQSQIDQIKGQVTTMTQQKDAAAQQADALS